jgi:hypothetical protein
MDSMSTEFAAVIHYQFPHGKKPTISIDHLVQNQLAILGIYVGELATSQDFSGGIIQNNADFDIGSINLIPVDMSRGKAVLAFVSVPFAPLFLPGILMGQAFCFQIHVYSVMRDADLVLLSDHPFKHSRPEPVAGVRRPDNLCLSLDIRLLGTTKVLAKNRL